MQVPGQGRTQCSLTACYFSNGPKVRLRSPAKQHASLGIRPKSTINIACLLRLVRNLRVIANGNRRLTSTSVDARVPGLKSHTTLVRRLGRSGRIQRTSRGKVGYATRWDCAVPLGTRPEHIHTACGRAVPIRLLPQASSAAANSKCTFIPLAQG